MLVCVWATGLARLDPCTIVECHAVGGVYPGELPDLIKGCALDAEKVNGHALRQSSIELLQDVVKPVLRVVSGPSTNRTQTNQSRGSKPRFPALPDLQEHVQTAKVVISSATLDDRYRWLYEVADLRSGMVHCHLVLPGVENSQRAFQQSGSGIYPVVDFLLIGGNLRFTAHIGL